MAIDLDMIERRLAGSSRFVMDTETDGLDWKRNKICGWVLTFGPAPQDTFYLPVRHGGGANLDPGNVAHCIRWGIKRNPKPYVIGFALGFDLKMMTRDGVGIDLFDRLEDCQINAFLINEHQRSFSLDSCARAVGAKDKKGDDLYRHLANLFGGEPNRDQMEHFWKLAGDDVLGVDYAVGDGESTWDTWEKQQPLLDEQELRQIWDIECRTIRPLSRMELRGVRVDEARLHQVRKLVDQAVKKAKLALPGELNTRSPKQMEKLFRDAGHTDWPITEKGNPSFPEHWLITNPLGRQVVTVRKFENLENSFMGPLADRHLIDGRVHTTFNQTRGEEYGTVTGRLSSSQPNMQQVPKRNELLGPLFRSIFIPDDGLVMAGADYNQCEPRLLAHYGEVKLLIDGYLSDPPIDAHSMVAKGANIARQAGKTLNQALLTGAGDRKAALMLNLPMIEAMKIVNAYFRAMPEIKPFQENAIGVYKSRKYLKSLLGRRMRLDDWRFGYRGPNRILQGGNADIIKNSMARIDEELHAAESRTEMLLNVHDDIVYQFPDEDRHDLHRAVEIMEDYGPGRAVELTVPMLVDVKSGENWAEASYGRDVVSKAFADMGAEYK